MPHTKSMKNEQGQTMTEFALVLPILIVLLFGIIQFGIAFRNSITLADAVRTGARTAAVNRTATDPAGAATAAVISAASDLDTAKVKVTVSPTPWTQGGDVTVQATYPYEISILGLVVTSGDLKSSTTERVE
jgi:Flp pilus assembly protein TadG